MDTRQTIPEWKAAADEIWAVLKETDRIVKESAQKQAVEAAEAALRLAEIDRIMKESAQKQAVEIDRIMKESALRHAEIDRSLKETDRIMKENAQKQAVEAAEASLRLAEIDRIMKENAVRQAERSAELDKKIERVSANVGGLNRSMGELIETLIAARLWEKFPEYGLVRAFQRVPIHDETNRVRTDIDILLSNTDKVMAVEVKRELDDKRDVDDHLKRMKLIRKYPPLETVNKQLLGAMAGGVVTPEIMEYAYEVGFYVLELTGESVHLIPPPAGFTPRQW